jgi:hypothetical protein
MSEQVSARLSDEGIKSGELRLCLNLTREHVAKYDIEQKPYASVRIHNGCVGRYIVRFHERKGDIGVHPWKISINKKKDRIYGATLQLEPTRFKLDKSEKVLGVMLDVEPLDEGFVFSLDPTNFEPKQRESTRIRTKDEKEAVGFNVPSAWGEQVQIDVEDAIIARIEDHLFRKYGGKRL